MKRKEKRNPDIVKFMIPLCLYAIFDSAFTSFSSVLSNISDEFPRVSTTMLQYILTLPSLVMVPMCLFAGILASYMRKKTIAQCALVLMFAGEILPVAASHNIYVLFASSALIGVGQGLLNPISSAIVCERYDGIERSWALGIKQTADYAGSIGLTLLIGFMARTAWTNAYSIYFLMIPIFILTVRIVPRGQKEQKLISRDDGANGMKALVSPQFLYYLCFIFAISCGVFCYYIHISLAVAEKFAGTSASTSVAMAFMQTAALLVGLTYAKIVGVFKKYSLALGVGILALGFVGIALSESFVLLLGSAFVAGLGIGLQQIGSIYFVSRAVPEKTVTIAISATVASVGIGGNAAPVALNAFNRALFGKSSSSSAFLSGAVLLLFLLAVELLHQRFFNASWNDRREA